jgi:hypothetical protein
MVNGCSCSLFKGWAISLPSSLIFLDFSSICAEMGNRRPLREINNVVEAHPYPVGL